MPARRPPPVRLAAVTAVACLLTSCATTLSGHGSATTPTSPLPPGSAQRVQQPASFTDCADRFNLNTIAFPGGRRSELSFTCAELLVPLDYKDPSAGTVSLALLRVHERANKTGNVLVVNPGGPGGSGVELAVGLAAEVSDKLLTGFDLLGFDPRGVGASDPISCTNDADKDRLNSAEPNVLTPGGLILARQLAQVVATKCTAKYGASLADFNTVQTAKDMDQVRQAVANSQLNYLGFSYGTELGSVYAHLFPDHVRVEVLDGAVDPLTDDITSFANQLKGFEGAFDQFAADCRIRSACASLTNPRQTVYDLVKRASRTPLRSSNSGETRTATGSVVLTGVLSALYSQSRWPDLSRALLDAQQGDAKGLLRLADEYNERSTDGHYTNLSDANTAINCNDSRPGPSDAEIKATAKAWATAYPMFGLWAAPSLFACQVWQPARTPVPLPTASSTPQKVLVVGNLHDPATPYQGAKDLVKTMGNAALLTWDGQGHTSYLQGSSCVDRYVENYLLAGTIPPPNTTCPR